MSSSDDDSPDFMGYCRRCRFLAFANSPELHTIDCSCRNRHRTEGLTGETEELQQVLIGGSASPTEGETAAGPGTHTGGNQIAGGTTIGSASSAASGNSGTHTGGNQIAGDPTIGSASSAASCNSGTHTGDSQNARDPTGFTSSTAAGSGTHTGDNQNAGGTAGFMSSTAAGSGTHTGDNQIYADPTGSTSSTAGSADRTHLTSSILDELMKRYCRRCLLFLIYNSPYFPSEGITAAGPSTHTGDNQIAGDPIGYASSTAAGSGTHTAQIAGDPTGSTSTAPGSSTHVGDNQIAGGSTSTAAGSCTHTGQIAGDPTGSSSTAPGSGTHVGDNQIAGGSTSTAAGPGTDTVTNQIVGEPTSLYEVFRRQRDNVGYPRDPVSVIERDNIDEYSRVARDVIPFLRSMTDVEFPEGKLCVICQDTLKAGIQLRCGHIFHYRCIMINFLGSSSCPLCRRSVTGKRSTDGNKGN